MYKAKDGSLVDKERWGWVVTYRDGTTLEQFDGDIYHNFGEIDTDNVVYATMHNFSGKSKTIAIPEGSRFIHYYDNIITPSGRYRLYCFGYDGEDTVVYSILPNDAIVRGDIQEFDML